MPAAYVQEFQISGDDTSTTNYDAVAAELNLAESPDGLLIHTAGFDRAAGVFRIFDVWETREQGEKFLKERLMPIVERMGAAAVERGDASFTPPNRAARLDYRLAVPPDAGGASGARCAEPQSAEPRPHVVGRDTRAGVRAP